MLRVLLWLIFIYVVVKIIQSFQSKAHLNTKNDGKRNKSQNKDFENIQEADFEDITPRGTSDTTTSQSQR